MSIGNRFILAGIVYAIVGVLLGIIMGASMDFTLSPVHAHINLLGWVSMLLFGLVYRSISQMASEKLAVVQFWLINIGIIVMMVSLALVLKGNQSVVPGLIVGEFLILVSILIFAWLMWKHHLA